MSIPSYAVSNLLVRYSGNGFSYRLILIEKHYYSQIIEEVKYLEEVINFLKIKKSFRTSLIQNLYNDECSIIEIKLQKFFNDRKVVITRDMIEYCTRLVTTPFLVLKGTNRDNLSRLDSILSNIKLEVITLRK